MTTEEINPLLDSEPNVHYPSGGPSRLTYLFLYEIPMVEPILSTPSTPSHFTSGYPSPRPPKQKQHELTHIIYPKQYSSDLP